MAYPRTCVEIGVFHDRRDNKDGHARIIIMLPERILQRPDSFSQTASRPPNSSCTRAADHTYFYNNLQLQQ